jgi:phosphoribosyl-ATP pyrophosphohydrolase
VVGAVREIGGGCRRLGDGPSTCRLVEEAAECWMAAAHESPQRAAAEISQLLYHAQVMMLACGLTLEDVYAEL